MPSRARAEVGRKERLETEQLWNIHQAHCTVQTSSGERLLLLPQVPEKALSSLGTSSFQQLPAQLVQLAKAFQARRHPTSFLTSCCCSHALHAMQLLAAPVIYQALVALAIHGHHVALHARDWSAVELMHVSAHACRYSLRWHQHPRPTLRWRQEQCRLHRDVCLGRKYILDPLGVRVLHRRNPPQQWAECFHLLL